MRRLRTLSETECYVRCYGVVDGNVRVIRRRPALSQLAVHVSGEELRRRFEERLDAREPEAA